MSAVTLKRPSMKRETARSSQQMRILSLAMPSLVAALLLGCPGGGEGGGTQPVDASDTDVAYKGPTKGGKRPDAGAFGYTDPPLGDASATCCPVTFAYASPPGGTVAVIGLPGGALPLVHNGTHWGATRCRPPNSLLVYRFRLSPAAGPIVETIDETLEWATDESGVPWNVQGVPDCFDDAGRDGG